MKLRKLKVKDAPLMLEWMHDLSVVEYLQTDFKNKTIEDCKKFIELSKNTSDEVHLAVVNDNDDYMGTVSLKNITSINSEFAITIRKSAMGKGYSEYAMKEIFNIGFNKIGLKEIYWCVDKINSRARRFYDKNAYNSINIDSCSFINDIKSTGIYSEEQIRKYIWYCVRA